MRTRRRVIHLITGLDVGGAELYLLRLLSQLDANLIESKVICLRSVGVVGERMKQLGIAVEGLEMQPSKPTLTGFLKLIRILMNEKPDVLMTWLYHADLMGLLAGKLTGVKNIIWNIRSADMDMSQYHPLSAWVVRLCTFLSGFPSVIFVNSRAGLTAHQQAGYRPRRWEWIPNGVNVDEFLPNKKAAGLLRKSLNLPLNTPLVGMLARVDPMKDHATFLRAARKVAELQPKVHFLLAGEGCVPENGQLSHLINENQLQGKIHLIGLRQDVSALFAGLDVYLSSSITEGFPNAIAEAMACGVPVAATDAGDSAYLIGETGLITPVGNAQALAESCLFLLNETKLNKQNRRGLTRKRIVENFDLRHSVKKYQQFLLGKAD